MAIVGAALLVVNADTVREAVVIPPTPEPTRSAASYAASAALLERDGDFEAAIEAYQQALRLDGSRVEFYIPLIDLLTQTGRSPSNGFAIIPALGLSSFFNRW